DRDTQRSRIGVALAAANAQATAIFIFDRGRIDAHRTRLHGIESNGWDQVTWNAERWWLDPR
ncbi:MAG TPA: hypothetical protein VJQ09_07255, partial [Candidatus Limnocylindria bacterium]|nr:hypothetical protein [Candidatus Limnocylindria bacterium]